MFRDIDEFRQAVAETMQNLEDAGWNPVNTRYFKAFLIYIMSARADIDLEDINNLAKDLTPERSGEAMTIAEKLIQEGMEQGKREAMTIAEKMLQEGIQKGIEKGRLEEKRKTAKTLLLEGFTPEQAVKFTNLSMDEILELKKEIED